MIQARSNINIHITPSIHAVAFLGWTLPMIPRQGQNTVTWVFLVIYVASTASSSHALAFLGLTLPVILRQCTDIHITPSSHAVAFLGWTRPMIRRQRRCWAARFRILQVVAVLGSPSSIAGSNHASPSVDAHRTRLLLRPVFDLRLMWLITIDAMLA